MEQIHSQEPQISALNLAMRNRIIHRFYFQCTILHPGPILLKTAVSIVRSHDTAITANILFDEGSQSSFVTKGLGRKLQLEPTGSETLCMLGFGDTERCMRHLNTATVYLETSKPNIPIKVLIVPEISVPLKSYHKQAGQLTSLKGLKIAHPMSEDEDFEIEILIGADHYWDVVGDQVIRGDRPTAIQPKIRYILSGTLNTDAKIPPFHDENYEHAHSRGSKSRKVWDPLTPSHLLYGCRITSPVYPDEPRTKDMTQESEDKLYRFKSTTLEHFGPGGNTNTSHHCESSTRPW